MTAGKKGIAGSVSSGLAELQGLLQNPPSPYSPFSDGLGVEDGVAGVAGVAPMLKAELHGNGQ